MSKYFKGRAGFSDEFFISEIKNLSPRKRIFLFKKDFSSLKEINSKDINRRLPRSDDGGIAVIQKSRESGFILDINLHSLSEISDLQVDRADRPSEIF